MLNTLLLVAILVVLIGILTALKAGLNEVIRGLEAVADRSNGGRRARAIARITPRAQPR